MLPASCSHRLLTELQGALGACQRKEKELEQSIARCRVLLQPWEVPHPPSPEPARSPETEPAFTAHEPAPKDVKELELLTQALEKALRVRKGISPAQSEQSASSGKTAPPLVTAQTDLGARPRTSNPKACVPAKPPTTSQRASSRLKKPARASCHREKASRNALTHSKQSDNSAPIKGPDQLCPLPSQGQVPGLPTSTSVSVLREAGATGPSHGPEEEKTQTGLTSETFTLKEKGTQLQLPPFYKKIASRNSRLWAQVQHSQSSADTDVAAAKARFLERMKVTFDLPGPAVSLAEIQEEVNRLDQACHLLTQHLEETLDMNGEAATASLSWEQEYHRLVTLEGLQTAVEQHLLRLQELQEAEEQWLGPRPVESSPWGSALCLGGEGSSGSTGHLVYSSVQELQTVMALKLQVAMLKQQIHLEKVLMEELLPLVKSESPAGPAQLALYRAIHSQLCEAGECFSILVRDEPSV
ncbi:tubulin epsilon and delta complex protein 2 isoform X3 [Petaurus breviceps papuanus]|uniref:tubulin epsilon and delta complex protein 2 isoform X3 n=1 Tax=Petaurus breviceps papuanus TaxID=3040969 RepID=UPI0036DA406A